MAAKKESDDEPLCKGRNQIIIVADNRVPQWADKNSTEGNSLPKQFRVRNFQSTLNETNTTGNSTLVTKIGMKVQTVGFRKYFTQVSGSVRTALFNSFLAFIFIITASML